MTCDTSCVSLRLAAISLLVLQGEEDAFWCLVAVVETIMPQDYYTKNLVASQVRKHTHLMYDHLVSTRDLVFDHHGIFTT